MDAALLFAAFRRLTGYPVDSKGIPLMSAGVPLNIDGKMGLRVPLPKNAASSIVPDSKSPDAFRFGSRGYYAHQYQQVPVYVEGTDTKRWANIFPSCSVTISDVQMGGDPYLFDPDEEDGIGEDSGTTVITNDVTGVTFDATTQRVTRRNPEPWDVYLTFSLYETDAMRMALLTRAFLALFPQRGSIEVEQYDGTFRALDLFYDRTSIMDQGEPYDPQEGIGESSRAFIKQAYTYRCETSLDNSADGYNTNDFSTQYMTLERTLEMATITDRVVRSLRMEDLGP